jgi:hypothetical protein
MQQRRDTTAQAGAKRIRLVTGDAVVSGRRAPASNPHDIEPVARQRMRGHPLYEEDENDMMSSNDPNSGAARGPIAGGPLE